MMGGSCTNICYHNQMYLLFKRKRLNTVALRITEAKHIIAGASCVSVSIGAFWTSICWLLVVITKVLENWDQCLQSNHNSVSIWGVFGCHRNINMEKLEMDLCHQSNHRSLSMGAPFAWDGSLCHLSYHKSSFTSKSSCFLCNCLQPGVLIVINAGRIIRLLIVITADCHHCWLSSLRTGSSSGCLLGATWICNCLYLEEHTGRWWNQINSFSHKVLWPRDWLLRQPEFRLYREDSHGEDPAPPGIVVHFHARRQWSTRDITCNVRLTMVDPWYCATIVRFPVDRRSCEQGEYLDDVRSNRWQLGGNVIHNRRQYNCQLKITVAHEPWLTVICQ